MFPFEEEEEDDEAEAEADDFEVDTLFQYRSIHVHEFSKKKLP